MSLKSALNRVAAAADIPWFGGLPEIRVIAMHTVLIEPHGGIRSFSGDCVLADAGEGLLCVRGHGLVLKDMSRQEIRLTGDIKAVEWVDKDAV